jgi:opacity protein-like surface antigen
MKLSQIVSLLIGLAVGQLAFAQSSDQRGWEGSIGLFYQDKQVIGFKGGSFLRADDDFGVIGAVGFNFNSRFDLIFGFDSATVGYDLRRLSASTPGLFDRITGDYESFTPFVKFNFNLFGSAFSPFISAGVGWSFIDTNIPTGRAIVGCWWDPWWGYFCAPFAETKTVDAFAYQAGAGVRWRFNQSYGIRLEYQKQWLDLSRAVSPPGFDQIRLTFVIGSW